LLNSLNRKVVRGISLDLRLFTSCANDEIINPTLAKLLKSRISSSLLSISFVRISTPAAKVFSLSEEELREVSSELFP
jgi:hypothetical protein